MIRSATFNGAELLSQQQGRSMDFGVIRPGKLADLIIVPENPIANLKVLYGTGAIRLNDQTGQVERVGGVKYTIKDGIVYDAKKLLEDVARIVEAAKAAQKAPQAGGGTTATANKNENIHEVTRRGAKVFSFPSCFLVWLRGCFSDENAW